MSCPFQYYEDESSYYPMLYCKVSTKPCLYRKRCDLQQKYIPIDGDDKCYILMEKTKREIPNGSYYVKATQVLPNGLYRLYVEIGSNVVEIKTNFKEFNQDYIYLDKDYKPSLTPIVEKKVENKNTTEVKTQTKRTTKKKDTK